MKLSIILFFLLCVGITSSTKVSDAMGVNIHFTTANPGELEMISKAWKWIRMDFLWQDTEQTKGVYDFSEYDKLMNDLENLGMRTIFILDYSNSLYSNGPPINSTAIDAFVSWALAGIDRFKGKGVYWECWNEPNGDGFWPPKHNATAYSNLCNAAGDAINQKFPNEIFMGPALSNMKSFEALDFAYEAFSHGVLKYFNMVSTHGYGSQFPEQWLELHDIMKLLLERFEEGKSKTLINSEWGYNTVAISEEKQSQYLTRAYLTTLSVGVPLHIWYDWRDDCQNMTYNECHFGTVRNQYYPSRTPVFEPKPSYYAALTLTKSLGDCQYRNRLLPSLLQPLDNCLSFICPDNSTKYAVWTLNKVEKEAKFNVDKDGCFKVVDWLGGNRDNVCSEKKEVSVSVSEGPVFLSPLI